VTLTGSYRGISEGDAPLVGILVDGRRRLLKWLAPAEPSAIAGLVAGLAQGDRVSCEVALDEVAQRMILVALSRLPASR